MYDLMYLPHASTLKNSTMFKVPPLAELAVVQAVDTDGLLHTDSESSVFGALLFFLRLPVLVAFCLLALVSLFLAVDVSFLACVSSRDSKAYAQ